MAPRSLLQRLRTVDFYKKLPRWEEAVALFLGSLGLDLCCVFCTDPGPSCLGPCSDLVETTVAGAIISIAAGVIIVLLLGLVRGVACGVGPAPVPCLGGGCGVWQGSLAASGPARPRPTTLPGLGQDLWQPARGGSAPWDGTIAPARRRARLPRAPLHARTPSGRRSCTAIRGWTRGRRWWWTVRRTASCCA